MARSMRIFVLRCTFGLRNVLNLPQTFTIAVLLFSFIRAFWLVNRQFQGLRVRP